MTTYLWNLLITLDQLAAAYYQAFNAQMVGRTNAEMASDLNRDTPPPAARPEETHSSESPCECRFCGRPGTLDHVFGSPVDQEAATEPLKAWALVPMQKGLRRFAQVICANCDARGPKAEFDTSDDWPHIWADQVAIAKWNTLHWVNRKQAG